MKRIVALVAVGLAIAVGLLWWFGRRSADLAAGATPVAETTSSPPSEPDLTGPDAAAPETRVESPAIAASAPITDARPIPTLEVLAVDNATGAPVADAKIFLATTEAIHPVMLEEDGQDIDLVLRQVGDSAQSDASGKATLPWSGAEGTVSARRGRLFGFVSVDENSKRPVRIPMCIDRSLRIRTVDALGSPCPHVPVRLWMRSANAASQFWSGTTGLHADVEVRHVESACLNSRIDGELSVVLAIPTARLVQVIVPTRPWTDEPITLVVPANGSLVLTLVDDTGAPMHSGILVALAPKKPDRETFELPGAEVESQNGVARFEHVEIGLELTATVRVPGHDNVVASIVGPTQAGEQVRATIRCGPQPSMLTARLVDPQGAPFANRRLVSTFTVESQQHGYSQGFYVESDADGHVEQVVSVKSGVDARRSWRLSCEIAEPTMHVEVDISRELPPGVTDLGELRMSPTPLLAAGRVVDDQNRGIAGATVSLQGPVDIECRSDVDGRFRLVGSLPSTSGQIVAWLGESVSAPIHFSVGASDLRLVLPLRGSIVGKLLVDDNTPVAMLQLRVARDDGADGYPRVDALQLGAENEFRTGEHSPGRVSCSLELAGETIWSIAGIEVRGGETTRDPRMQAIDLRELFRTVRIEVLAPDRTPVEGGYVGIVAAKPGRTGNAVAIEHGEALIPLPAGSADLEIHSQGYRTVRLAKVDAPRTVVLERAIEVRLVLAESCPLPKAPHVLQANLVPRSAAENYYIYARNHAVGAAYSGTNNDLDEHHTFGPSREIRLLVDEPGLQKVYFVSTKLMPFSTLTGEVVAARAQDQELEIGAEDEGRRFLVAPDPVKYAEAMARQD